MTNIVEASNMTKEIQAMSRSKSKSPKGDFATIFKEETETLKPDMAGEGEPVAIGTLVETEEIVKEPSQERVTIDEEVDENDGAISLLSSLIQGSPPRQIKSSIPGLKSVEGQDAAGANLPITGNLEFQEPSSDQLIKGSPEIQELAKVEEINAFKVGTSAPEEIQKVLPQEIKETVTNAVSDDLTETKFKDVLPEKLSKRDAIIASENRIELEPKKFESNTFNSKILPKIEESLEKIDLAFPSGETKEKEASSNSQKKSQVESMENLPSTIKANGIPKLQIASPPEVTKAQGENLEVLTKEILHQMETLTDGNKTMVTVKLNPEEMGEMEISLSMEEGRLTGKIVVGNKEIQQIFTDKLHELNQTLKENRIDVASFEVKVSPDQNQNQNQDQARHQGRRAMEYSNRFNGHRNGSTQTEEWRRPAKTSNRGIDILA